MISLINEIEIILRLDVLIAATLIEIWKKFGKLQMCLMFTGNYSRCHMNRKSFQQYNSSKAEIVSVVDVAFNAAGKLYRRNLHRFDH